MNEKPIKKLHSETESTYSFSENSEDLDTLSISPEERRTKFHCFVDDTKHIRIRVSDLNKDLKVDFYNFPETSEDIQALFETLIVQFEFKKRIKKKWTNQEKVVFVWVVYKYSKQKHKSVEEMNTHDWINICKILGWRADPVEMIYKWFNLQKSIIQMENWTPDEDEMLLQLVMVSKSKNKWNTIAKQMYEKSKGKYLRLSKHCRERWKNHLDPSIKKEPWTAAENLLILNSILTHGKKWSKISKQLNGRPENSIKNHYIKLLSQNKIERSEDILSPQFRQKIRLLIQRFTEKVPACNDEKKSLVQENENPSTDLDSEVNSQVHLSNKQIESPGLKEPQIKEKDSLNEYSQSFHDHTSNCNQELAKYQINMPKCEKESIEYHKEAMQYHRQAIEYYRDPMQCLKEPMPFAKEQMQYAKEQIELPKESMQYPKESMQYPKESLQYPKESLQYPKESMQYAREQMQFPREQMQFPREQMQFPREQMQYPKEPIQYPKEPIQHPKEPIQYPKEPLHRISYFKDPMQFYKESFQNQGEPSGVQGQGQYNGCREQAIQSFHDPSQSASKPYNKEQMTAFNSNMQFFKQGQREAPMNYGRKVFDYYQSHYQSDPSKYPNSQSFGYPKLEQGMQFQSQVSNQATQNYWPSQATYPCITYVPVITHKPLPMPIQPPVRNAINWNHPAWDMGV